MDNANPLDELAKAYGTDKSSSYHNYVKYYHRFFNERRFESLRILEIGIQSGASLKMWHDYFPASQIFGIDVDPNAFQSQTGRIKTFIGDQSDENFLRSVINSASGSFDIIIDDGGHKVREQVKTFSLLFPTLLPAGIYVIEDMHSSYWDYMGGGHKKEGTAIEMIKDFIDEINFRGNSDLGDPKRIFELNQNYPFSVIEKRLSSMFIAKSIAFLFCHE